MIIQEKAGCRKTARPVCRAATGNGRGSCLIDNPSTRQSSTLPLAYAHCVIGMGLFKWASLTTIDSVELAPSNNALSGNQCIEYDY